MDLILSNINHIHRLCKKYNVAKLFIFGSIVDGNFTEESDIDFLVEFLPTNLINYADNYFEFKFSLEKILNRKIDLIEINSINNPFLLKTINQSKKLIYG